MYPIGRKQLPHEAPEWVGNPSGETYFITICTQDRSGSPLLQNGIAERLLEAARYYNEQHKWWTELALVMPDHVHLLASFREEVAPPVRAWKHWTARHLGVNWQRDFFDHRLRRDEKLNETAEYILNNPIRAGLVDDWQKWPHLWIAQG